VNELSQSRIVASPHLDLDSHCAQYDLEQYDTSTVRNVNSDRVFYFHPSNGCYICDFHTLTDGFDYDISSDSDSEMNQMMKSQLRDMRLRNSMQLESWKKASHFLQPPT